MTAPVLSGRQSARIHAMLGRLGVTDRAEKLRLVSAAVYRRVTTTSALSASEAQVVIVTLAGLSQRDAPAEAIARLIAETEGRTA